MKKFVNSIKICSSFGVIDLKAIKKKELKHLILN